MKNEIKLFDSELKVMEVLWETGGATASKVAAVLGQQIGWSKTTTYTVIKKCIDKGAVQREGSDFFCRPLVTKDEVRAAQANELINRMFDGSADLLVASILGKKDLSTEEIQRLKQLVDRLEREVE